MKVSYRFFEDIYRKALESHHGLRSSYRGYYVYAVDGDQLNLPASKDVLQNGFRGYPAPSKERESHYPKMYTAQAYDVINGLVCNFKFSTEVDEVHLAREMVREFEKNSIVIYDRFHCGYDTFFEHELAGTYYLVRARTNPPGAHKEVTAFHESDKRSHNFLWRSRTEKRKKADVEVRLVKIKNPRSGENLVFATNLPKSMFSDREIAELYLRRWDIEGSFKDLTHTLKMEEWHSKKINGILQEIYALLWLVNAVKMQMRQVVKRTGDWLKERQYKKANFKLSISVVVENLHLLRRGNIDVFYERLNFWIKRSTESRKRLSRTYPRVIHHRGREYTCVSSVPRRPLTERH